MLGKVLSVTLSGMEGQMVQVEADLSDGIPSFDMVGIPGSEVRESRERVKTAFHNSGITLLPKRITINLSPADVRKRGSGFDLPVAVAILASMGFFREELWTKVSEVSMFCGELSLDGSLCATQGVLAMVLCAREAGCTYCFVPADNAKEASCVDRVKIIGVHSLAELFYLFQNQAHIDEAVTDTPSWEDIQNAALTVSKDLTCDFSEINGQFAARRAAEIAVAGMHNLLMTGPPGSGKSMIARRLSTIMPPLSYEESLELTKIYSVCGMLNPGDGLITQRPFRAPHHTISASALAGGGVHPVPGEISLANRGVLFLDELTEFRRQTLEVLRQPMEDHMVSISRLQGRYEFPSNTMIVAAMNPCRCGYYPDADKCQCTSWEIRNYQNRISGPFLDRIDLMIEVLPLEQTDIYIEDSANESSLEIQKRIIKAHQIQQERFKDSSIFFNSQMSSSMVKQYCKLDPGEKEIIESLFSDGRISTRGYFKLLKVARTIADLEGTDNIQTKHLLEAFCYRTDTSYCKESFKKAP